MSYDEISASRPVARKEYRCEWCNQAILVGEKHFSRTYKFCGEFQSGRMHLDCEEAMGKSDNGLISEGWMAGDFKRGEVWR